MDKQNTDFTKYLKQNSVRHHYIPKFLLNGFTNEGGLLFIYDKQKDKILRSARPPRSVFFEEGRNTIELKPSLKSSILEDLLYSEIDNKASKVLKKYQTEDLGKIEFLNDDESQILFFLITLFWRIPKTDYAASNLMDVSIITTEQGDPEILRNDPTYRKFNRAFLFKHHINEIKKFGMKGEKSINLHENEKEIYVIGDYPFLLRKHSGKFSEFNDTDILFAISSRRIYSSTNEKLENFAPINSLMYNACIIEQSVKAVACGNLRTLERAIAYYKKVKEAALIYSLPEEVFRPQ
jgi:hypothetical protein